MHIKLAFFLLLLCFKNWKRYWDFNNWINVSINNSLHIIIKINIQTNLFKQPFIQCFLSLSLSLSNTPTIDTYTSKFKQIPTARFHTCTPYSMKKSLLVTMHPRPLKKKKKNRIYPAVDPIGHASPPHYPPSTSKRNIASVPFENSIVHPEGW